MAKLPVRPACWASASVRQRFGGRSRVNLLKTASAAGHASVHCVRRDASVTADGGDLVFIYLSATSTMEWVRRDVSARVVALAAALVIAPNSGNSKRLPSRLPLPLPLNVTRDPSIFRPEGNGHSRVALSNSSMDAR